MLPPVTLSQELERQCLLAVEHILKQHSWRLLQPDELTRRALDQLRAGAADRPEGAAIGAYCMALHAACSGAEGLQRQNQAYDELARYLYSMAGARFADLSLDTREDVTQATLERVFKSFERCREPVAFLAFATLHLLDAVRAARRQVHRPIDSLEQARGANHDAPADRLPDAQPQPIEQVLLVERRMAIERLLGEIAADHPRATQRITILRLTWLDDLDDLTISRRLGISMGSIYTARSRLIKAIQSEPKWNARARELGLLSDEV